MKVQAGDVVHVRGRVVRRPVDEDGDVTFETICAGGTAGHWCRPDQIVHVEPRALQVGDKVRISGGQGEILAIDDGDAWVKFPGSGRRTYSLASLERI